MKTGIRKIKFSKGIFSSKDVEKIKNAGRKPPSPNRKSTMKKWVCGACSMAFFYSVMKCPACESGKIAEAVVPTLYEGGFI